MDGRNAGRAKLIDVARVANVSVQTASHVLSGNPKTRVAQATRIRVREAAKAVGYSPNKFAQAMKYGRSNVISVWLPLDRPTHTYFRILEGLSARAQDHGYSLMIIGLNRDLAYQGKGPLPTHWPVDGLIAIDAGKAIHAYREDPNNDSTPIAVMAFEEYANADTIGWDVAGGVEQVVSQVIASGRHRVLHLSPSWIVKDYPREQRRCGYTSAMEAAGQIPEILSSELESSDSAEEAMSKYLLSNPAPDCLFAFSDSMAIGASRALLNANCRIPDDCWVVGFGDSPESADFRVPMSSLRVPVEELVAQTWDWLLKRIESGAIEPRVTVLQMDFVERQSTGSESARVTKVGGK